MCGVQAWNKVTQLISTWTTTDNRTCDKEKAEVLSDSFSTVFVVEAERKLPQIQIRDVPRLRHMENTQDKIKKGPAKSKKKQVSGPDAVHPGSSVK